MIGKMNGRQSEVRRGKEKEKRRAIILIAKVTGVVNAPSLEIQTDTTARVQRIDPREGASNMILLTSTVVFFSKKSKKENSEILKAWDNIECRQIYGNRCPSLRQRRRQGRRAHYWHRTALSIKVQRIMSKIQGEYKRQATDNIIE
jgi:hypothetical protein